MVEPPEQTLWPKAICSLLSPAAPVIQRSFQPSAWSCEEGLGGSVAAFPHLKAGIGSESSPDEGLGYMRLSFIAT